MLCDKSVTRTVDPLGKMLCDKSVTRTVDPLGGMLCDKSVTRTVESKKSRFGQTNYNIVYVCVHVKNACGNVLGRVSKCSHGHI